MGRMTFAVYLVHPIVIFIYVGNRRDLNYVDDFSVVSYYVTTSKTVSLYNSAYHVHQICPK